MTIACKAVVTLFAVIYLLSLGLLAVGTLGLFGVERDPLTGVYLIPLGLPWTVLMPDVPDVPGSVTFAVGALAPAINLAILIFGCRALGRRRR